MVRKLAALARAVVPGMIASCVFAGAAHADDPLRIVSINLCADQLLMALAEPAAIAGLSPFADDPRLSFLAEEAGDLPTGIGTAEQVVARDPDLVLAGRFTRLATRDMLARLGYEVMLLDPARSIDDSIAQITDVGARIGASAKAAALVADIRAAAEAARSDIAGRPSAAIYQRRGYVTGGGTLTDDLLELTGYTNHGAALADGVGGFVSLEGLVREPPDVLVVAETELTPEDQGAALLAHPAVTALFPAERRVLLPERLTVCGGPSLPAAIRWLASEAERLRARAE